MQTLSHGIYAGSVDNTHELMSVDTPLQNLKADGDKKQPRCPSIGHNEVRITNTPKRTKLCWDPLEFSVF